MSPANRRGDGFALRTAAKLIGAAVIVFVLAWIAIPDLIDAHNTPLLFVAIALGFVTLGVIAWTVLSIRRSYRRRVAAGIDLIEEQK